MDQQSPFQYKVLESNSDYKQALIEKTGLTAKFTIAQVEEHQATLTKLKKELEGQINVDSAKMVNVEHFHPNVMTMSDEEMAAAAIYIDAKTSVANCTKKLAEVSQQIDDYKSETDMIMTALGFQKAVDPSPVDFLPDSAPSPETAAGTPVEPPIENDTQG